MSKSTITYWNVLQTSSANKWEAVQDTNRMLEQITLSIDQETGDYTRLTRFKAGADTKETGGKSHDYPEEIYIISGRLYDEAFDVWLEAGHYARRPPGKIHGPFKCEEECLVLEVSYPSQSQEITQDGSHLSLRCHRALDVKATEKNRFANRAQALPW